MLRLLIINGSMNVGGAETFIMKIYRNISIFLWEGRENENHKKRMGFLSGPDSWNALAERSDRKTSC